MIERVSYFFIFKYNFCNRDGDWRALSMNITSCSLQMPGTEFNK